MKGFLGASLSQKGQGTVPAAGEAVGRTEEFKSEEPAAHRSAAAAKAVLPALPTDRDAEVPQELQHPVGKAPGTECGAAEEWDAARAAAVVAEVDRIIAREVAPGGGADTESRRQLLRNDALIVRRLQQAQDPLLWAWPDAIWKLMARWRKADGPTDSGKRLCLVAPQGNELSRYLSNGQCLYPYTLCKWPFAASGTWLCTP
jgi:hypothetical protein